MDDQGEAPSVLPDSFVEPEFTGEPAERAELDECPVTVLTKAGSELISFSVGRRNSVSEVETAIRDALLLPDAVPMVLCQRLISDFSHLSVDDVLEEERVQLLNVRLSAHSWPPTRRPSVSTDDQAVEDMQMRVLGVFPPVEVRGENFIPGKKMRCKFGTSKVMASYISDTLITCVTPPHAPGPVSVEFSSDDLNYTNDGCVFTYIDHFASRSKLVVTESAEVAQHCVIEKCRPLEAVWYNNKDDRGSC